VKESRSYCYRYALSVQNVASYHIYISFKSTQFVVPYGILCVPGSVGSLKVLLVDLQLYPDVFGPSYCRKT